MSRYTALLKTLYTRLTIFALVPLLAFSARSTAETSFISDLEQFDTTRRYFEEFMIVPTRMMDDEDLFLAAQIQRENRMSSDQRLINNYWLLANHNNDYGSTGGAALGRLFREALIGYWKQHHKNTDNSVLSAREQSDFPLFGSYKLRVSSDRIVLAYEYRF